MTMIRVLEHDASNSLSVLAALRSIGLSCSHVLPEDLDSISSNSWLVIPGVGHMNSLSASVDSCFGIDRLKTLVIKKNLAVLGICLGFQFLCLSSAEDPHSKTLGLIDFPVQSISIPPTPSVGWYQLKRHVLIGMLSTNSNLINQLMSHEFYFTHSYAAVVPSNNLDDSPWDASGAQTFYYENQHGEEVVGAIVQNKFVGLQFHPEKSGRNGLRLLRSILTSAPFED